ncbi:hypothetical protein [Streptomyces sp. NPDC056361]|uniref:hypothetical protein n=1 Tax=Streptomyces sp. NPDC056361 TaxID=3345795 RepID=UPI0035DA5D77
MSSCRCVTFTAVDETILRESPIYAMLARLWFDGGRFVPGPAGHNCTAPVDPVSPELLQLVPASRAERPVAHEAGLQ